MSESNSEPEDAEARHNRLHALIEERSKAALAGVKRMMENPYTREQMIEQRDRLKRDSQNGPNSQQQNSICDQGVGPKLDLG